MVLELRLSFTILHCLYQIGQDQSPVKVDTAIMTLDSHGAISLDPFDNRLLKQLQILSMQTV